MQKIVVELSAFASLPLGSADEAEFGFAETPMVVSLISKSESWDNLHHVVASEDHVNECSTVVATSPSLGVRERCKLLILFSFLA